MQLLLLLKHLLLLLLKNPGCMLSLLALLLKQPRCFLPSKPLLLLCHPLLLLPPQDEFSLPLLVENHLSPLPLHPLCCSPLFCLSLQPLPLQHQLMLLFSPLPVPRLLLQLQLMLPLASQPLLLLLKQLLLLQLLSLGLSLLQLQVLPLLLLLLDGVDLRGVVGKWGLPLQVVKLGLQGNLWLRAELLQRWAHVRLRAELLLCKLLCRAEHVMVGACSGSRGVLPAAAAAALLLQFHICCWAA